MSPKSDPKSKALEFLSRASQFQLGQLPTELPHPRTTQLSQLASADLKGALALLKEVELEALRSIDPHTDSLREMAKEIHDTFSAGRRVFFCGCGATGRLSVSLEVLWREARRITDNEGLRDSVISFIAGGDFALVRSIENFEDHPEYGARQLRDLGFHDGDLLIGTTEGGETPFVIGAVEEAEKLSARKPYILFCNPPEELAKTAERCRRYLENPRIRSLYFATGPMAVAGSTRLQATTVLMLAAGSALFTALDDRPKPEKLVAGFVSDLSACDFKVLAPLIEREAALYSNNERCVHQTRQYGMTVLTDTTERSPTFSLASFENETDTHLSWTYLCVRGTESAEEAWTRVLKRPPRSIDWDDYVEKFGSKRVLGFDFSPACLQRRLAQHEPSQVHVFDIDPEGVTIAFRLDGVQARIPRPLHLLREHLLLKCALNASSTLTMGRAGRFSGNIMLYVRASNNKLIDRSIRFIQGLLKEAGHSGFSYDDVCLALFETLETLETNEPAVLKTFERLQARTAAQKLPPTA